MAARGALRGVARSLEPGDWRSRMVDVRRAGIELVNDGWFVCRKMCRSIRQPAPFGFGGCRHLLDKLGVLFLDLQ